MTNNGKTAGQTIVHNGVSVLLGAGVVVGVGFIFTGFVAAVATIKSRNDKRCIK